MTVLENFRHLDAHTAFGVTDSINHIRMCDERGYYHSLCGAEFFDWVRLDVEGDCEECLSVVADLLSEQALKEQPKFERIDWYAERNVLRAWVHEHRN